MAVEVNPYAAPASALEQIASGEHGEYGDPKIFSFRSRAGRLRYLVRYLLATIAAYIASTVLAVIVLIVTVGSGGTEEEIEAAMFGAFLVPLLVLALAFLVITSMFIVQRLHDLDLTGWLCLLMFIPLVNLVFGLYVLFAPGSKGPNGYGPPPPPNTLAIKVTAGVLIFLTVAGFVVFLIAGIAAVSVDYDSIIERAQQQQQQQ